MRRFSFGTFLVDDRNQVLYETCRAVANLSYRGRLPVVLVAPDGFGKTHLLYSIVNRARSGPARTGVAFVSADDFPDEVRKLVHSPDPVERARNAILLVDDLHRFTGDVDALDKLVDLFLKHGHYVVMTSAVATRALTHLPAALRRRLDRGHVLQIAARADLAPAAADPIAAESSENIGAEIERLRRQWKKTQADLDRARGEIQQLRNENDTLKQSAAELGPLWERIEALQERVESRPAAPEPHARQQAGIALEKAAALLEEVEVSRSKIARIRELNQSNVFDIKQDLEPSPKGGPAVTSTIKDAPDTDAEHIKSDLEKALAERKSLLEDAERMNREIEGLRGAVARANEERDETRRHLRAAFEKLDRYEKNLEQLRAQVSQYAEEQDHAVEARARALTEVARIEAVAVAEGLREVQEQFAAGLRTIDRMAGQLDALCTTLDGTVATPSQDSEPFFVTPAEDEPAPTKEPDPSSTPPRQPQPQSAGDDEAFVPGIGVRQPVRSPENEPPPRSHPAVSTRRTLHHVEELDEIGLFSYPEDRDASI